MMRALARSCCSSARLRPLRAGSSRASSQQRRRLHTTATPASSLRGPPCFSLEASVGVANPLDLALLSTGVFGAEVHPNLPGITTWHGLYKQLALRLGGGAARRQEAAAAAAAASQAAAAGQPSVVAATDAALSASSASSSLQGANNKPVLHVATVGAQLRSVADAADSMCAAAGVTPSGRRLQQADHSPHADALLLVSGSHPARQLPFAQQLLPGTLALLQRGSALQQAGVLPPGLELWAVANPLTERDASYTEQKVAAGAQVILTQPPLDWEAFAGWLDDAQRRGVMSAARVLVGFPCLSSAANAGFWAALCNAGGNAQCKQLEAEFRAAETAAAAAAAAAGQQQQGGGKGAPSSFSQQWNRQLLAKLQATPGLSGLHVMPITGAAKRLALQLAQEGAFAPAAWPQVSSGSVSRQRHEAV